MQQTGAFVSYVSPDNSQCFTWASAIPSTATVPPTAVLLLPTTPLPSFEPWLFHLPQGHHQQAAPREVYQLMQFPGVRGARSWFQYGHIVLALPEVPAMMHRNPEMGPVLVGQVPIAAGSAIPELLESLLGGRKCKRCPPRCASCLKSGNQSRILNAQSCNGRLQRIDCPWYVFDNR